MHGDTIYPGPPYVCVFTCTSIFLLSVWKLLVLVVTQHKNHVYEKKLSILLVHFVTNNYDNAIARCHSHIHKRKRFGALFCYFLVHLSLLSEFNIRHYNLNRIFQITQLSCIYGVNVYEGLFRLYCIHVVMLMFFANQNTFFIMLWYSNKTD